MSKTQTILAVFLEDEINIQGNHGQLKIPSSLFEKTQNTKLLSALKSFMELHQGICYVTDTCEDAVLELSYRPEDLALLDSMSLKEFVKTHRPFYCNPTLSFDDNCGVVFN